ncbi:MAG: O-acetyl-ADP-ribose deacetylase [Leptospiraceae bacterium]|nr:O-acetyl-ADP-ribose deacetylase [Leptospiraceae bacterium]MCP5513148.1 O-acetyl-ADP-ribose deacetylase [Leptospiraceae bacterium]
MQFFISKGWIEVLRIELLKGDITDLDIDVIVNAANSKLAGGGGVDGAIHRAGGPAIMAECDTIRSERGYLATGDAVITTGGLLKARYVIHTVGPIYSERNHSENLKLTDCYTNSLKLAQSYGLESIAFPNISTGAYGFPPEDAAILTLESVSDFLNSNPNHKFERILFISFDSKNHSIYQDLIKKYF